MVTGVQTCALPICLIFLTAIKSGKEKNWKVVKNIRLPELKKDGFDVTFSGKKQNGNQPLTRIEKSITTVNNLPILFLSWFYSC